MNNKEEYTWDLTKIFKSSNEFNSALERIKNLSLEIIKLKGTILNDENTLLKYLKLNDELSLLIEKVYVYSFLDFDTNMNNRKAQETKDKVLQLNGEINNDLSFVFPELLKSNYNSVLKLVEKNDELKKYKFDLELTYRYKNHVLSEKEESLLAKASTIFRTSMDTYNVLNNVDVKFDKIKDENNKKVELNQSNYSLYLESTNRNVRKSAFNSLYKYYKEHINTISSIYINSVRTDVYKSKVRNYKSTLESSLYEDNINKSLYTTLIKVVNDNVKHLQKYYKLKSKILGLNKMHLYDTYAPVVDTIKDKIDYDEGKNLVVNALSVIGENYIKDFKHILNNRCIDVFYKKGKRSGAYQWGCYSCEPYVLLNYESNINSVSTLAHEMGHAMHSYYSDKHNEITYAGYPIFLAEIASTVNEILFSEYMYNNIKDNKSKMYYLVEFLDKFKASVYRQTMFAEFEYIMHDKCEKGESLTKDLLCEEYYKLNEKYFGSSLVVDSLIQYEWARIPHFYTSFYVYKYSTGFISALVIANKLLSGDNDFKNKYMEFLSSGGSDYPLNILKKLGIDIEKEDTMNKAFNIFKNKLNELDKIIKESGEKCGK